ncbi:hypothetical protein [Rheinheimera fenheensis]|uniref:hypothetical protein n=1 Tax=Rheinheimera fenheensis TaxID=3152295 RepID=UPI003261032F
MRNIIIKNTDIERLFHSENSMRMCEVSIKQDNLLTSFGQYISSAPPFMCDTGLTTEKIKEDLDKKLLHLVVNSFALERSYLLYIETIIQLFTDLENLKGVSRVLVSVRNFFAPGDTVWHVDRSTKRFAIRAIWPLARRYGTLYTPIENIDLKIHSAYMTREHPLLSILDRQVFDRGVSYRDHWKHRPLQVESMQKCEFSFVKNPLRIYQSSPKNIAMHRFDTGRQDGSYHCSSSGNEMTPGLQTIFTATE